MRGKRKEKRKRKKGGRRGSAREELGPGDGAFPVAPAPPQNPQVVLGVRSLLHTCAASFSVSLRWLKGHANIPGNALADALAGRYSSVTASASLADPVNFVVSPLPCPRSSMPPSPSFVPSPLTLAHLASPSNF